MNRIYLYLISFLLLVPPLIFFTDLTRNPYYFQIMLVNAGTVVVWMIWLYRGVREKKITCRKTPLDLPLWIFLAAATLSWGAVLLANLQEPYLSYGIYNEGLKRWLFLLVNAILVYYMAVYFVNEGNRSKVILVTLWTGWLAAAYGILQYFSIEFFWPRVLNPFGGRSVSTFGNPNFLSSYLVLLFPLAYVFYLKAQSSFKRFFYLVFLLTYFAALLCTLTRSSWMGLLAGMVLTVGIAVMYEKDWFRNWKRALVLPFGIMMLLILFWPRSNVQGYSPTIIARLAESTEAGKGYYAPWHQRRLIWSCAWHMVLEKPVLGKGWGSFELFYPSYQGRHLFLPAYHAFRTHANNCHNEILEIWSQTGTLGFGIYLWLLAVVVGSAVFLIRNLEGEKRILAVALSASLVAMWVDNLLNVSLHFAIPGFLFWWNLGLLISLGRAEEKTIPLNPARLIPVLLLLAVGGLLVFRYGRLFVAETQYFKGFKLSKANAVQSALPHLEKAHRLQRFEVNNNYELANCYARTGEREKAIWGYREALRANAGYDEIYFNMATVLLQLGRHDEAIQEYSRSLYLNPLSAEAYNAMGSIFLQDPERFAPAGTELLKQCVLLFPQNKDMWNNLGYLYTKSNRDVEAMEAYKRALEIDPDFELARRNVRVTLAKLDKTDRHLDEVEGLYAAVEQSIGARNWQSALTQSRKLVDLVPRSFKARLYLANVCFTMNRLSEAIEEYKEALKLQPGNTSAMGNLGLAYFENKQYDLSKQELQKLLQADPQNQTARQKLEQINSILLNPR